MSKAPSIELYFEDPETITIAPPVTPGELFDFLKNYDQLVMPNELLDLIGSGRPIRTPQVIKSLVTHRLVTLTEVERVLPDRAIDAMVFGWLLREQLTVLEGPLEGGDSHNIFWLPSLATTVHRDPSDGKLRVEPFKETSLTFFDKVFVRSVSKSESE